MPEPWQPAGLRPSQLALKVWGTSPMVPYSSRGVHPGLWPTC